MIEDQNDEEGKHAERKGERRETETEKRDLPPVQWLSQSVHIFTGGVEDAVPAPDPQLAGTRGWIDATADKVLSISPPADPGPSVVTLWSSCNSLETTLP